MTDMQASGMSDEQALREALKLCLREIGKAMAYHAGVQARLGRSFSSYVKDDLQVGWLIASQTAYEALKEVTK